MVSIGEERARLKNVDLCDYRLREQWGARRSYTDSRNVIEPATRVFVHISVTNPGSYSSFDRHAQAIEAIGISRFPNTGISYNRLIQAGSLLVYEGQPMGRRGAHTVNDKRLNTCTYFGSQCPGYRGPLSAPSWNLNYNARSYCYLSNVQYSFDDNSLDTMARAIAADKLAGLVTQNAQVHGHRCVAWKSCPGDNVWDRMHELESKVNFYLQGGSPEVALNKNETTDAVWDNDRIPAPNRYPGIDNNPVWLGRRFVQDIADAVVYPRANDPLIKLVKDPVLSELAEIQQQIEATEIRLVELQQETINLIDQESANRIVEHTALSEQLTAIQRAYYLTWEELGLWQELPSWNQLLRSVEHAPVAAIKEAAHAGSKEALSEANLEVNWE